MVIRLRDVDSLISLVEFAVANISDISWSPSSYVDVKMPEKQKKPVWALAEIFLSADETSTFKDLVQGKGRGINFLL